MTFNYPKTTGVSYSLCVNLFFLDVDEEADLLLAHPTVFTRLQDTGSLAMVLVFSHQYEHAL
jgi:hypothetical protein